MKKRIFACLLLVALCLAWMPVSAEGDKVEIVVWEMYGPDRGMPEWADQFNAMQDKIHVKNEFMVSHTELMQKLQVVSASNADLPNLILVDMFYAPVVDGLVGGLVDLTPYLAQEEGMAEDFYANLMGFSNIDGRQISLHGYANNIILYYNRALFEEAGLDPDAPPETWDQLIECAQALTTDDVWGFHNSAYSDSYYEVVSWNFQTFVWQAGGEMWTEDYKAAFNTDEGRAGLQFMVDMVQEYKVATTAYPENGFQLGKVAMIMEGTWMNNEFQTYLEDDLGATSLPYSVEPATNTGGEHWMIIPSTPEQEDASWAYMKYMLSEEIVTNICSRGGQVPTRISIADSEAFQSFADERPGIRASMDSMPFARMRANSPKYSEASEAIAPFIEQAIYGTTTVDDAITQAEAAWNAVMGF